jgi:hypothetical protein
MTLADYLPFKNVPDLEKMRTDCLIFGSGFPNLRYAWDLELKRIAYLNLDRERLLKLLSQNAVEFYTLKM